MEDNCIHCGDDVSGGWVAIEGAKCCPLCWDVRNPPKVISWEQLRNQSGIDADTWVELVKLIDKEVRNVVILQLMNKLNDTLKEKWKDRVISRVHDRRI